MTVSRRTLLAGALAAPIVLRFATIPAGAAAPAGAGAQVIALQKVKAGSAVVTAISDGFLPLDAALLTNTTPENTAKLLAAEFVAGSPVKTGVNTYLVALDGRTILIDAGGAGLTPSLGRLAAGLEAAGVAPGDVDAILMTHLHVDHIGGLLLDGKPVFAKAEVHLHAAEAAFWTSTANRDGAPDAAKAYFDAAKAVVDAYGERIKTFSGETEVLPGISSRELFGHTPGHTGYVVGTGEDALLIWGDIVHIGPVQMADPNIGIAFDTDPAMAVATRKRILAEVAAGRTRIAGMHIAFPGIGHVKSGEGGAYDFEPSSWTYEL